MSDKQAFFQHKFNDSNFQIKYNISFQSHKSFTFKIFRDIIFKRFFI